ncbi:MAG: glycosyltransferase family 2 protein [Microbacteriaceae bacterium]|nr:MAG: glycosyltransferase family 2 protein [Microbacteriaceae bacterium]
MTSITVVIPVLNDSPMLENALTCLAAQLRPADEIVVVDNGSTDDSASIASAAGVRVISQPTTGIWPAASAGYDAARGDIIARIDADSRPPVDWLMHIEAEFTDSPDVGVLTGPGDFYDGNGLVTLLGQYLYIGGYFWAISLWLGNPPVFGSNFAMKREVWSEVRSRVHSTMRSIHDDLDLSMHLPMDAVVRLDDTLRVGISARPFASWSSLGRRLGWAYLTLRLHWPEQTPWRRHIARLRRAEQDEGLTGAA